jgi:DNA-binding MarR family transcriptional regulator
LSVNQKVILNFKAGKFRIIFFLTDGTVPFILVNTMNNKSKINSSKLKEHQVGRLRQLIEEIIHCCQERVLFQSQKFNLTPAELRCILVFTNDKYLTAKGMAQKLEVAKSRITKIMEGLTQKKLVQCIDDPDDARVKLIRLTPAGQNKLNEIDYFINEIHHQLLMNLNSGDRTSILHSLELLHSSMEAVREKLV